MTSQPGPSNWVTTACTSGKRCYPSRRAAKKALEQAPLSHMRPYRCPDCPYWHNGHLPRAVMRGERTAEEHYHHPTSTPETAMTTHVATLNATRDQIEEQLLAGKSPAEVVNELQEPMPNVLQIFRDLRDAHRLPAGNHSGGPDGPPNPRVNDADTPAKGLSIFGEARAINDPKINRLADRADTAMTALRDALHEHTSKASARAEVARLEAELKAARERLTGRRQTTGGGPSKLASSPTVDQALECRKGCGGTAKTPAGRSAHERFCTGTAAA